MAFLDPVLVAELLLLGTCTGFLAGLLGVGGGMLMVPFLTMILTHRGVDVGLAVKMAIATAMTTIMFTSIASVRAHAKRGAVRWDIVRHMAPGIVVGALIAGIGVFAMIKGAALALAFAAFVSFSALQMLRNRKPAPSRQMPGAVGSAAAGGLVGFVSGLVGAGGAFISVPFMTWCNVPIHLATGTSAALGFPIALSNTVGYIVGGWNLHTGVPGSLGFVVLPAMAVISVASVITAPMGAKLAHSLDIAQLKRVFAVLLFSLAGYMTWRALFQA
jgi:uncharacterized membrane protein YfcA